MLLSLNKKQTNKKNNNNNKEEQQIIAPAYITGGDGITQLL